MTNSTVQTGRFVWHDLMTSAPEDSVQFYTRVFGWDVDHGTRGAWRGLRLMARGKQICGVVGAEEHVSAPNSWLPYATVGDLAACVERTLELHGRSPLRNAEVAGSGRFAVIEDPTGAMLAVCEPGEDRTSRSTTGRRGGFCWHELATDEPRDSVPFYQELFGWTLSAWYHGNNSPYWYFAIDDEPIAGIRSLSGLPVQQPLWLCHVAVDDVKRAVDSASALDGEVLIPPADRPSLGRSALIADPLHGALSVTQPRSEGLVR